MQTIRRKIITKTKLGMRLFLLSAFVLIMSTFASYAVEPEAKKLSFTVETGMFGSVANTIDSRWQIRKSAWSYYDYSYSNSSGTYNDLQIYYVTVKPEYLLFDDKLCVSAGLRFSNLFSTIATGVPTDNNAFYLLYNQTNETTEYARVKEINQNNYYLSVPFELTFIPWRWNTMSLYAKVGAELGVMLDSQSDILFLNSIMDPYKQLIMNNVGVKSNAFYSTFYTSVGVKFGKPNKLKYNFELNLPSRLLSDNNSSLLKIGALTGFSFSVSVPFK